MRIPEHSELDIPTLGSCRLPSPLRGGGAEFIDESGGVLVCSDLAELQPFLKSGEQPPAFEPAGPRSQTFFDAPAVACGIVTCGGLCPGVNNVIRSIVLMLHYGYGVKRIIGFRYGYAGLSARRGFEPWTLSPQTVDTIHERGGTILGTSRGPQDVGEMVDTLAKLKISILFAIGGDGTLKGVSALNHEIARRGLQIAVIGVPKTIDNDLEWIERSFGFATAVEEASSAIEAAHGEARAAWNGIGLVKLMGRESGHIAAHASLANSDVNFCLVPEVPFALRGGRGFLKTLERRLKEKHHAVIVVAEGTGQDLLQDPRHQEHDASGNLRLKDVGTFLKYQIGGYFAKQGEEVTIKYIDPSYIIRSLPANSLDSEFCLILGQHAVHAGMAGRTNMMVGFWNQRFTHVPIPLAVAVRKRIDPDGAFWQRVLEATGQPAFIAGGE